jgi:hypothetical protein
MTRRALPRWLAYAVLFWFAMHGFMWLASAVTGGDRLLWGLLMVPGFTVIAYACAVSRLPTWRTAR